MLTQISTKKMIKPPKTQNKKKTGFLIFCSIVIGLVILGVVMDWVNQPKEEQEFYCLEYGEGIVKVKDTNNFTTIQEYTLTNQNTYYNYEEEIRNFWLEEKLAKIKINQENFTNQDYWSVDYSYTPINVSEEKFVITFERYFYHHINYTAVEYIGQDVYINYNCTKKVKIFGGYKNK